MQHGIQRQAHRMADGKRCQHVQDVVVAAQLDLIAPQQGDIHAVLQEAQQPSS